MSQFLSLVFKPTLIYVLLLSSCGAASNVMLSPELGLVSVCPGGRVLLTCERLSGPHLFLYWTVSIPRLATSRETIVSNQGDIDTTALQFNGLYLTEFNVTRTSGNPLTSQMMVNNVTTEMNGSTIYCSEDGNENGAPVVAVNVIIYYGRFLNVSLVSQLLEKNVTVTLQWPREAGAVYSVITMPETPHTEFITNHNNNVVINLTIFYNIQYNVSIVSSLCGVTTTKVLKYVTCDLPTQLLNHLVSVVNGSQDSPHREGQFITYTCSPGFVQIGPNASVCTGSGEWEPDPGQTNCIADCRVPVSNAKLNYSSTLEGSILTLTCENDTSTDEQTLSVICHSSGSWIPDPAGFTCSPTAPPDAETSMIVLLWTPVSSILIAVCAISSIVFLSIGYACGWFSQKHKQSRSRKATSDSSVEENTGPNEGSQLPQTPGPLYEELLSSTPEYQDLVELKENVAYGPIVK